nr:MAG TPA: hypothetical protein [Caudoviricetes sp.]
MKLILHESKWRNFMYELTRLTLYIRRSTS